MSVAGERSRWWLSGLLAVLVVANLWLIAFTLWNMAMRYLGLDHLMLDLMHLHRRGFFV